MTLIPTLRNMHSYWYLLNENCSKFLYFTFLHIGFYCTINANTNSFPVDSCNDFDKPVITIAYGNCTPASFSPTQNSCMGYLSIKVSATDDQTPDELISFEYKIDLYNDGRGTHNGFDFRVGPLSPKQLNDGLDPSFHDNPFAVNSRNPMDASGTYPIGIHKICWYAEDTCGNQATLCQLFEVEDCEAPVAVCVGGVQTFYLPINGCITLWAKDFDKGSFDNCSSSENLKYYFDGNNNKQSVTYCCDDFIFDCDQITKYLQFWVVDEGGNGTYCNIVLIIINRFPYDICCDLPLTARIYCELIGIKDGTQRDTVPKIVVSLYQNSVLFKQYITGTKYPDFFFGDLHSGLYSIDAKKYNDSLNNVSTLDIIGIQKHILRFDTFTNSLQFLAADVDSNKLCNNSDAVEIRNLILANQFKFKKALPWKIIPVIKDSFALTSFIERLEFEIKPPEKHILKYRIIKMGDVNDLVSPMNYKPLLANNIDSLIFKYKNQLLKKGEKIKLDIYAKKFHSIVGFQGTIKYDNTRLIYQNTIPGALLVDNNSIGVSFLQNGQLPISWNDIYERTYPQSIILFTLEFEAVVDGDLCDALSFTSDLTPAEAYTDSVLIKNIKMESCDVILSNKDPIDQNISIYPNPFRDIVHFGFTDKVSFPVELSLYDQNGKQIQTTKINSSQNDFSWELNPFHPGIYFIKIKNDRNISFRKIIKL